MALRMIKKLTVQKFLKDIVDKGFLYAVPTAPQGDYYYAVSGNRIALNNCSYGIEKDKQWCRQQ